MDILKKEVRQ